MNTKTIIGLELHVELSTNTKMFCSCKNEFGAVPNTNICPICLGHPGTLPVMNEKALEYAIIAAKVFHCEVRNEMKMDRKKYFYPDLVKGYQITQQDLPYAIGGYIDINVDNKIKKIRLNSIHMEEDTAKSNHDDKHSALLDYNRAGVGLIEIVTEPDINTPYEARKFIEKLRDTLKFLKISNAEMSEGSLRCDVNINVLDIDTNKKTKITEIKNLNSIKSIEKALEFEEERHNKLLLDGLSGNKETRRWVDTESITKVMRLKESGNDYRFSVEGDIPKIKISDEYIKNIEDKIPELPEQKYYRYLEDYNLNDYDATLLSSNRELSNFFEQVIKNTKDSKLTANWILTELLRRLKEHEIDICDMKLSVDNFSLLLNLVKDNKINNNNAKKILRYIFDTNDNPLEYAKINNFIQVEDDSLLENCVNTVLSENRESVEAILNGKDRVLGFLVGQCMKKSKGKLNPKNISNLIEKKIHEYR